MTPKSLSAAFTLVLAAALSTGPLVFAQASQSPAPAPQSDTAAPAHAPDPHRQAMHLARQLSLTADQTSKLETILADRDQKIATLRADSLLTGKAAKQQMHAIQQNTRSQLSNVLSRDQLNQLESMQRAHAHKGQAQPATAPTV